MAGTVRKAGVSENHRLTLRFSQADFDRMKYWAEKADCSINEFIILMLEQWIDIQNGNYELPTLEVQRLNQLIESHSVMARDLQSLTSVVINGFDSLLSLTKGDNYLLDDSEDGELDI